MKREFTKLMAALALLVFMMPSIAGWAADETITFSQLGLTNGTQYTTISGTYCTLTFGDGVNDGKYYTSGAAIRVYGGGHMTVSSATKNINKIELTFGSGDGSNEITTDVDTYSNGTWQGSAQSSVTFNVGGTSGHRRIASVAITYTTGGGTSTTYTVTYGAGEHGSGTMTDSHVYEAGDEVTLLSNSFEAEEGYEWSSWLVEDADDNEITVTNGKFEMPASNVTVTAQWTSTGGGGNQNVTYDFTQISDFSDWGTSFSQHVVTYSDAIVTFESANHQNGTITDQPVTKGQPVSLVMIDGSTLSGVTFVCTQWVNKAQTITLHYSTDGGTTYTSTGTTSSNFTITNNSLPAGTNAVKITFSSSSNQVGIASATITKAVVQPSQSYDLTVSALSNVEMFVFDANDQTSSLIDGGATAQTVQVLEGTSLLVSVAAQNYYVLTSFTVNGVEHLADINSSNEYPFTMPSQNVTITATAAKLHDVYYSENGVVTQAQVVSPVTLPIADDVDSEFTFAGWTLNPNDVEHIITQYTFNDDEEVGRFYAVYMRTEGAVVGDFELITENQADWNGKYLIAYDDVLFADGRIGGKDAEGSIGKSGTSIDLSEYVDNNTVPAEIGELYYVTLESYTLNNQTYYYFKTQDGKYNYHTSNDNNGLYAATNASSAQSHPITVSFNNGYVDLTVHGGAKFHYNSNTNNNGDMFRFYSNGGQNPVHFYKQAAGNPGTPAYYTRVFIMETASGNINLSGPSIVPSGSTLNMGSYSLNNGLGASRFIIEDGAQVKCNNSFNATMKKTIEAYPAEQGNRAGYYLIATPLSNNAGYSGTGALNLLTEENGNLTYDFYQFSYLNDMEEWRNYKVQSFNMSNGVGYLYANQNGTEINFVGLLNNSNNTITSQIAYFSGHLFSGWYLKGNPYTSDAYISTNAQGASFFRMNEAGDGFVAATGVINPMEGFFVQVTEQNSPATITISRNQSSPAPSALNVNLMKSVDMKNGSTVMDNAIIRFDEGNTLEKFRFGEGGAIVYIPQGGKDYAVVCGTNEGEMPVNFEAAKNGTYTLSVEPENVEMNYLHLIDNKTGNDVDLLATPSYTFNANTGDNVNRFRLVFNANGIEENDTEANTTFAYFNGSEWVINNPSTGSGDNATLQVIDMMGRVLSSQTLNGNANVTLNQAAGIYMLRLVNGENVKVQKVVVR